MCKLKYLLALVLAAGVAFVAVAAVNATTLTIRETDEGVERIEIDEQTHQVSVYLDDELIETRAATDREIAALARQKLAEEKQRAVDDLRSSVADIKGRPLLDIDARLDRVEQAIVDLAAAIGVE